MPQASMENANCPTRPKLTARPGCRARRARQDSSGSRDHSITTMAMTPPTPPALTAASASESIYSSPADQSLRPPRQVPRDSRRSHSVYIGGGVLTAAAGVPGPADQHAGSHLTTAPHHYLKVL